MQIDIIVDTICPWCYIGMARFERALALRPNYGFDLGWRPFQLNPAIRPEGRDRQSYLTEKFGAAKQVGRQIDSLTEVGRRDGIEFRFDRIRNTPNTVESHRLILAAEHAGRQREVVAALFRAYFCEGRDLGDRGALAEIGVEAGLDRDTISRFLMGKVYRHQVIAEDEMVRRLGVNGVPCYIIEQKFAISGAQPPEVFVQVFDLAQQDAVEIAAE